VAACHDSGDLILPIRIYALAKELSVENKELVDICTKAGITGKGSALASLDDDEVTKVKAYLSGESKPKSPAAAAAVSTVARPKPETDDKSPMTRGDYIPSRTSGKIKVLGSKSKKQPDDKKKEEDAEAPSKAAAGQPRVKLAQMPDVKQPTASEKQEPEEKVQKPDIALPKDAIASARTGKTAPLQQFTSTQQKKTKPAGGKGDGKAAKPGEVPLGEHRGKSGRRGKATEKPTTESGLGSIREARQKNRKERTRSRRTADQQGYDQGYRRPQRRRRGAAKNTAAPRKEVVALELPCSVRSYSENAGVPAVKICFTLANMLGIPPNAININTEIDEESAHTLAEEFGVDLEFKQAVSLEETVLAQFEEDDDAENLKARPPVITFLGHVDHGKTSLLDRLIGINVVDKEAGGITQHIEAYQIEKDGRKISFVDTPGHEAFTEMRARGANVTDIAVLVIAADDGVMPQTIEAISHAKAAEVPIIVALNKIDLPSANPDKALQDLAAQDLLPSEWGGEVDVIRTSAITGEGLDELLETVLVTAELHEYGANPDRNASGVCLEARQDADRGVVTKMIVKSGTLKVGDIVVCGTSHGRVKAMYDTLKPRRRVAEAEPSMPVNVTGLDSAPEAGDSFHVLDDITKAREVASQRGFRDRTQSLSGNTTKVSFEDFQQRLEGGTLVANADVTTLNLIVKADVRGSIEAIQKELEKLKHPEVQIKILQASVGGITVGDITLAYASQAVVVGFNVAPDDAASEMADARGVQIRRYNVIYKVTEDVKATLEGKLKPEQRVVELGNAMVKEVFQVSRSGVIAGCHVTKGAIHRNCRVRVNRDGRTIGEYPLDSLRRHKEDVREVPRGMECGMKLAGFNDVKVGDFLEAYKIEEVARTL